ncbi:MAG: hypothetical protein NPIRA04_06030 [Nitrospirales bacterium]|nr:MAG: hypothetical protein NPIRA04_06030 [Nitrospirales bacterium]
MDEGKLKREGQAQRMPKVSTMTQKFTMRKLTVISLTLVLVYTCGTNVSGCALIGFPSYSWHQKMTVEVEVEGQTYTGSSVVAMSVRGMPAILPEGHVRELDLRGEAVVVELPKKQYLFALLTYDAYLTGKVFHDLVGGVVSQPEEWASEIDDVQEIREIHPKDYPLLVTFTDINDPKMVKQVDSDNLEATFGPGVSLKRITLEITDEPVTEGKIEKVLGWLVTVGNGMLDGQRISSIYAKNRLANSLSRLDFKRR